EQDHIRLIRPELPQPVECLDPVGGGDDLVALHLQATLEHEEDGLRIVGDEQAGQPAAPAFVLPGGAVGCGRPSLAIGSTKRKVAPSPGDEFAESGPPCSSTSDLAIASPRPVPPTDCDSLLSARQKRSKTWSSWSASRPGPLSETANSTSSPALVAASWTSEPSGAYLFAFVSR